MFRLIEEQEIASDVKLFALVTAKAPIGIAVPVVPISLSKRTFPPPAMNVRLNFGDDVSVPFYLDNRL